MFKYGVISGSYFSVFGLNTEIYGVNLRIQSEYRKIGTRNNSVFGHFLRSEIDSRCKIFVNCVNCKLYNNDSVGKSMPYF